MEIHDLPPYKEIAPRLAGLRESLDLSVEDFAAKLGVSPDTLSKYESGTVEIPVSFLMQAAHAGGIDLTSILSGSAAHLSAFSLTRNGEGLAVQRRKDYDYWNLAANFSGRSMEPFLVRVPPKKPEDLSFTSHTGQEFIYMLEGRLEIHMADKVQTLGPGDSLYFKSRIPHALRGLDDKDALFLDVIM